jgi:hypothetical protein
MGRKVARQRFRARLTVLLAAGRFLAAFTTLLADFLALLPDFLALFAAFFALFAAFGAAFAAPLDARFAVVLLAGVAACAFVAFFALAFDLTCRAGCSRVTASVSGAGIGSVSAAAAGSTL